MGAASLIVAMREALVVFFGVDTRNCYFMRIFETRIVAVDALL